MPLEMRIVPQKGLAQEPLELGSKLRMRIQWLGQAGFLIDSPTARIVIDPYLSDSLAIKYKGQLFAHIRMMPPPVESSELPSVDACFATHHHGDHLDAATVKGIFSRNPECIFVVPESSRHNQKLAGISAKNIVGADAFSPLSIESIEAFPIPAAHENLAIDDAGHHIFLGYIIIIEGITIYHAGDCIPYPGLLENMHRFAIDIALLPINGRDARRRDAGILGNFTLEEALELAEALRCGYTIGHHFGMFDFNTIDENEAKQKVQGQTRCKFFLAQPHCAYEFSDI